jgi:hypothetical protein
MLKKPGRQEVQVIHIKLIRASERGIEPVQMPDPLLLPPTNYNVQLLSFIL